MKHWIAFVGIVLATGGVLIWSQIQKVEAPVSPSPVLDFVADTERELSRLPVKFAPLPDADEIKIGKELEKEYMGMWRGDGQEEENVIIRAYVQQVGARVAAQAHRKLPYRFHYIPSLDFVNAFALPGGPVFIGGGLMALMDTEDELASVLGHEIEHIDHYHCAERVQVEGAIRKLPLSELLGIPVEVFVAGYSKNQELEADREGAKLAVAASYSAQGAIGMFQAFERFAPASDGRSRTPQGELSQVALETLEGYFRSHPQNGERIDQIRKMIANGRLPDSDRPQPLAVAYVFLTEKAWRLLDSAQVRPPSVVSDKEKRRFEEARAKQYREAVQLASQSLSVRPDQPRAREAVARAYLGLGEYDAAAAVYRELVPNYPAFADRLRLRTDSLAREALAAGAYDQAQKLALLSLNLQSNRAEALTLLLEAQLQLSDLPGATETAGNLKKLGTQASVEGSRYAFQLATGKFNAGRYSEAGAVASIALELTDGWEPGLILAKAQFALADFSAASKTYRTLLSRNPSDMTVVREYAEALAASHPSLQEAVEWLGKASFTDPAMASRVQVELAGVILATGDSSSAQRIMRDIRYTPELMGRLGWWYYKSGRFSTSAELLGLAVAQRPGDLTLQSSLAFNELEQHQWDSSIGRFTLSASDNAWNSPLMGRAVARWQTHQTESALTDFEMAAKAQPEWRNPRWVTALYSGTVAQSVAEMDAEQRKRSATSH